MMRAVFDLGWSPTSVMQDFQFTGSGYLNGRGPMIGATQRSDRQRYCTAMAGSGMETVTIEAPNVRFDSCKNLQPQRPHLRAAGMQSVTVVDSPLPAMLPQTPHLP